MTARFNGREMGDGFAPRNRWQAAPWLLVLACTSISAFATDLTSPVVSSNALPNTPPMSDLPSAASSLFRVIGAFALVIAVFFAAVWLFRSWQRVAVTKGHAPKLAILETKALGQRHAIYVIGYEQQRLLISASPSGVTMLTTLPQATSEAMETEAAPKTSFSEALRHFTQRKP